MRGKGKGIGGRGREEREWGREGDRGIIGWGSEREGGEREGEG